MSVQQFLSLFQQASGQGSRSTAMGPMVWLAGMTMATVVSLAVGRAPTWVVIAAVAAMFLSVIGFIAVFGYFAFKQPDALRSERFTLTKLALQESVRGDDLAGIVRMTEGDGPAALPPPIPPAEEAGTTHE